MPDGIALEPASSNARAAFPRKEALPGAGQDGIDGQQRFVRETVLEQCRCSAWSCPREKVRAVLRLDAADVLDDVRPAFVTSLGLYDLLDRQGSVEGACDKTAR